MTHDHLLSVDNDLKQNFDRTTKRIFGLNLYDKVVSYPNPSELVKGRSLAMSEWCCAATKLMPNVSQLKDYTTLLE